MPKPPWTETKWETDPDFPGMCRREIGGYVCFTWLRWGCWPWYVYTRHGRIYRHPVAASRLPLSRFRDAAGQATKAARKLMRKKGIKP